MSGRHSVRRSVRFRRFLRRSRRMRQFTDHRHAPHSRRRRPTRLVSSHFLVIIETLLVLGTDRHCQTLARFSWSEIDFQTATTSAVNAISTETKVEQGHRLAVWKQQ